eukprot:scaffold2923_cov121-Cylindrotheca_fusiformis.AAC.10
MHWRNSSKQGSQKNYHAYGPTGVCHGHGLQAGSSGYGLTSEERGNPDDYCSWIAAVPNHPQKINFTTTYAPVSDGTEGGGALFPSPLMVPHTLNKIATTGRLSTRVSLVLFVVRKHHPY